MDKKADGAPGPETTADLIRIVAIGYLVQQTDQLWRVIYYEEFPFYKLSCRCEGYAGATHERCLSEMGDRFVNLFADLDAVIENRRYLADLGERG